MKLIMENWRNYTSNNDFKLIIEKYNNNLITEVQYLNIWEARMIEEGNELFTEGLLDIISQGFEAGKNLTGELKAKFESALHKVAEWLKQKFEQIKPLVAKAGKNAEIVLEKIKTLLDKIKTWCKANKILCFIAKSIILAITWQVVLAILASAGSTAGAAMAAVQLPGGQMMTPDIYNVIQGMLNSIAQNSPQLAQTCEAAKQALTAAFNSKEIVQLSSLPDIVGSTYSQLMGWMNQMLAGGRDASVVKDLVTAFWDAGVSGGAVTGL